MRPLEGYRIVDLGWVWAGAIPGQILADLGAEVIKVESRKRLDYMRQGRPIIGDKPDPEQNPMFHNTNRNKLSLAVDLTSPDSVELLLELVCASDIVIENFTPDVMERRGLGYHRLRRRRPDIILLSMSPAGQGGPLRKIRSYATTISALSGLLSLIGYPGGRILDLRHPLPDVSGGLLGAFAVLAALAHRQKTGRGQWIDLSQWESSVSLLGEPVLEHQMTGRVPGPQGNRDPDMAPHGVYPCQEHDTWAVIAVGTDEEWRTLCRALEHPDWLREERFADRYSRLRHREALDALLAGETRRFPRDELVHRLRRAGIAAAPVLDAQGRLHDRHFQERNTHVEIDHPVLGHEVIFGLPWKFSHSPGDIRRRAPLLGEHTEWVLKDVLGKAEGEVRQMAEQGLLQ